MKSYRKELWFNIAGRRAFVNITPQVEACLKESGIKEGLILANAIASYLNRPCRSWWLVDMRNAPQRQAAEPAPIIPELEAPEMGLFFRLEMW